MRCLVQLAALLIYWSNVPFALAGPVTLQPKMGEPLNDLTPDELLRFQAGKTAFNRVFLESEGLGPIFNQISCSSCHNIPLGGSGTQVVTRFGFSDDKGGGFDPLAAFGGSLLQIVAITPECAETIPPAANVIAFRATPSTLGFGLVEAIPDADIEANALNPPPGIAGKAHMVPLLEDPFGPVRVGRFGWKSQIATVLSFSGDAALNEMGITNRLVRDENAPNGNLALLATCDSVPDPEDGPEGGLMGNPHFIDRVTDFQRFLAPPPQTPRSGMTGETLFISIGCADCHIPSFTTADDPMLEVAIRNKVLNPYSDFLVHDMGQAADFIEQGDANGREIRTPPLWGLRIRDALWHDGRVVGGTMADRIAGPAGVIQQHNAFLSRSQPAAQAFMALEQAEQDAIIGFLDSLGRAEFDHNGDNEIDEQDLATILSCFTGPTPTYVPDDPCSISDADQDGDVDPDDFDLFLTVYTGPQGDCNENSVADPLDLLNGTSTDCNANGLPDECDPESTDVALFVSLLLQDDPNAILVCMADRTGDGFLNALDIQPFVDDLLN